MSAAELLKALGPVSRTARDRLAAVERDLASVTRLDKLLDDVRGDGDHVRRWTAADMVAYGRLSAMAERERFHEMVVGILSGLTATAGGEPN